MAKKKSQAKVSSSYLETMRFLRKTNAPFDAIRRSESNEKKCQELMRKMEADPKNLWVRIQLFFLL